MPKHYKPHRKNDGRYFNNAVVLRSCAESQPAEALPPRRSVAVISEDPRGRKTHHSRVLPQPSVHRSGNVKEISSYRDAPLSVESHYRGDPCLDDPDLCRASGTPLRREPGSSRVGERALANFERHLKKPC